MTFVQPDTFSVCAVVEEILITQGHTHLHAKQSKKAKDKTMQQLH